MRQKFRQVRRDANGANERSEGTGGRRQASRLRLSLAFGARKNARSSPPSAKKNGYRSFWSRRASAQPTAGRPLAGRPEEVRVAGGGGRRSAAGKLLSGESPNERPQCGRSAKRVKAPRTGVSRLINECREKSKFSGGPQGRKWRERAKRGFGGRRQASRFRPQ